MLLIPGPVPVSPAVRAAAAVDPPSHLAPHVIEAFGASLAHLRAVWCAADDHQPFVVAGSGTLAMDLAVWNTVDAGDRAVVVDTGYFSERLATMLARRGADVVRVQAPPGQAPTVDAVRQAVAAGDTRVLCATHVDTSTGVRIDPAPLARLAREAGALSVVDGVCATAGEVFRMSDWGADVYLTASQKAVGLPPGLALLVASPRALARRGTLSTPPPLSLDWDAWRPIMDAYEGRGKAYFATPATTLILALAVGLREILDTRLGERTGMDARFALHDRAGRAMRAAWAALGLDTVPAAGLDANTLSAVRYPAGVGPALVAGIGRRGVTVAGGLHPAIKATYFRVGHMGWVTTQPAWLLGAVAAIEGALAEAGHGFPAGAGVAAAAAVLDG